MSKQNRSRSRAIRQRMVETSEPYTQAARSAASPTATAPGGDRLSLVLRILLIERKEDQDRHVQCIAREEAMGYRIVDGGQTGPESWEISDWRTGQVIERGNGGMDEYVRATERLAPDGSWVHIDALRDEDLRTKPRREHFVGIPDSFVEWVDEWVSRAPANEVASLVNWSEQQVIEHLGKAEER